MQGVNGITLLCMLPSGIVYILVGSLDSIIQGFLFAIGIFSNGHGDSMLLSGGGFHWMVDHSSSGYVPQWPSGPTAHWYRVMVTSS